MNADFDRKWGSDFIRSVPDTPGVYLFRNEKAELIYVGKAVNLRKRLSQYRLAAFKKAHRKMRRIVRGASTLEFQVCATETEALLLENQLIQAHRPQFNVVGAYAFLYPYLGLKHMGHQLALCYTTQPEILGNHGFQLFGAFRSRDVVTAALDALAELFIYIGHEDPPQRVTYGSVRYSRIACFRQIDAEWHGLLLRFFRGESADLLGQLFTRLLEKPGARRHAGELEIHFKNLRAFFVREAQRLRQALAWHGRDESMISQDERDALFIAMASSDDPEP